MTQIVTALGQLQDIMETVVSVRHAPDYPKEKISAFPAIVIYPSSGNTEMMPVGSLTSLVNIDIDFHVSRGTDLYREVEKIVPYIHHIPNAIANAFQNGQLAAIQTYNNFEWTLGALDYGSDKTIGIKFTMTEVKIVTDVDASSVE